MPDYPSVAFAIHRGMPCQWLLRIRRPLRESANCVVTVHSPPWVLTV